MRVENSLRPMKLAGEVKIKIVILGGDRPRPRSEQSWDIVAAELNGNLLFIISMKPSASYNYGEKFIWTNRLFASLRYDIRAGSNHECPG